MARISPVFLSALLLAAPLIDARAVAAANGDASNSTPAAPNYEPTIGARFENGIAAIVEHKIITVADIRVRVERLIPQIRATSRNMAEFEKQLREVEDDVIQNLIDEVLIVKDFYSDEKRKGGIPAHYVDNEIEEEIITEFENDRSKFHAYLRAIGKTQREYRQVVADRMIVGYMRGMKRKSQSIVSPVKIENYYNENRDRFYQGEGVHLRLIKLSKIADENIAVLEQTADTITQRLQGGASFADLAKEFSQDATRRRGGDYGWIARSDLRDELASAAFALKKGEHSQPIRIDNDIFLLYAEDKRAAGIQPLEEVREVIEQLLVTQMARESQERWLERLRRNAYVRYFN